MAVATATALTFGSLATAASAEDATATLTLGEAGVLTLPAGDGVRDETTVTVMSDIATTLTVYVDETGAGPRVLTYAPIEIIDPAVPATITVPVDEFTPGHYEIFVAPTAGDPAIALLTVGSGEPLDVALSLTNAKIFTWSGASPRSTVANVSATDETGLTVPFTGTVTATVGGRTFTRAVASTTGAAARGTIYASKLAAGTGTVKATVAGAGGTPYSSVAATLKVVKTAINGVALSASTGTVYPVKDGYKDKVTFTVTQKSSRNATFPTTGSVKVLYKGKVVKSWPITSNNKKTVTWYGKTGGAIVPGTYTVKVTVKGPEGTSKTAKKYITVSGKKLVTKTLTKTYAASDVMTHYEAFDYYYDGACYKNYFEQGDFLCDAYDAYDLDYVALVATGKVTVPSAVVSGQKFGGAKVKLSANWTYLYGDSAWSYGREEYATKVGDDTRLGKQTLGTLSLPRTTKNVHVTVWLGEYATASANKFTATFTYKKLV
ncbi:hypothetical protein [Demequina maris]|uniref:hypothetical protein n=1 Tax=Demequina maris TaxID=1638982 RepID=UPI000781D6D8|nr:hypothetical protein [Demequina maris]